MEEKLMPLVSVIVPVYNGEKYLEKCIESIEAQTYRNLEIIIINDGSTDATGQICERLIRNYANVIVITLDDEGVSAARNKGMERAKGEFFTFVDADDRLRPETIEILYKYLVETESDVCGCGFRIWKEETSWQSFLTETCEVGEINSYTPEEYLEAQILNGNSRCWSKLYRRMPAEKVRFNQDLSIGEDMFFLVELMSFIGKITEVSFPGYGYYQNMSGAMNRAFTPKYMEQITCWEMAREKMLQTRPELEAKVTSILMISILLTAGKLAALSAKERKLQKKYIDICHGKLKKELQVTGAYELLPKGYQLKAKLFYLAPKLYLALYHLKKYVA